MLLMYHIKKSLIKKASSLNKGGTFKLNRLEVFTIRLGLYYRPYMKEFFKLFKEKKLKALCYDKDVVSYLTYRLG